jgi:hypothetical protein
MAQTNANLIWKIADLLRGPYQPTSTASFTPHRLSARRTGCCARCSALRWKITASLATRATG